MSDRGWEERLRSAAERGHAHEQAKDDERQQARQDFEARRLASTKCLEETITPALREAVEVAGEAGLSIELIVEPPDPDATLTIRSSLMKYELQDDASLLLVTHLPSGRVDKEPVPADISAVSVKERVARFVENHVNETVVRRFVPER